MGARGPVPKRSDQRHGHHKPEVPVEHAPSGAPSAESASSEVFKPLPPDDNWHVTAREWYLALQKSGQSRWYEPSDWLEAFVAAEVLSRMLESSRLSAQLFAAWSSHTCRLLVTEGDRRRVRIELERAAQADPDEDAGVASMEAWRGRLAGNG